MAFLKPIFFIVVVSLSFFQKVSSQEAWVPLSLPQSERYDDVFFLTTNAGFTINAEGAVFATTDAGESWEKRSQFSEYLRCIEFIDENIGFLGSLDSSFFQTTDGGYTWKKINQNLNSPFPIPGICALSSIGQTIYAGGKWSSDSGYVFKSTDAGQSWQFIDLKELAGGIVELQFSHPDTGFAAGIGPAPDRGSVILKTTDGGQTWKEVYGSNDGYSYAWKIQQLNSQKWVASIQRAVQKPMIILLSTDKGETWIEIEVDPNPTTYAQVIGFLNDTLGFTGGGSQLYQTNDGGDNWNKISLPQRCNRFFATSDTTAFLSGKTVYRWGKEEAFSIKETTAKERAPWEVQLTGNNLKVSFSLPAASHVHLFILSPSGKVIREVTNAFYPSGQYVLQKQITNSWEWNLIVLQTNYGYQSKTIIGY